LKGGSASLYQINKDKAEPLCFQNLQKFSASAFYGRASGLHEFFQHPDDAWLHFSIFYCQVSECLQGECDNNFASVI